MTVLVSFPVIVAKHLDKRNFRKEERVYLGSQLAGSVRHHEVIHTLFSYLWDRGPTGLQIQMWKRERVAVTALPGLCVKGEV